MTKLDNNMKAGDEIYLTEDIRFYVTIGSVEMTPMIFSIYSIDNNGYVIIYYKDESIKFHIDSINGSKFRKHFRKKNIQELLKEL